MQCIETETERKPAQEAATLLLKMESASTTDSRRKLHRGKSHRGKSWNGVALLASAVGLGSLGGLAWLYFYVVSAVQSTLGAFQP